MINLGKERPTILVEHFPMNSKKVGNTQQLCMAQRVRLSGGPEDGVECIYVQNGVLEFIVTLSAGMDIYKLTHRGTNISFITKNGLVKEHCNFIRRFPAGMLYTCGPDAIGEVDGHELHGLYHTIPAKLTLLEEKEDGILIRGTIRDTALFGNNLCFERTIETKRDSGIVSVIDKITNEGFVDADYAMLYHINCGYPMLDAGAKIEGDFSSSIARTPFAEQEKAKMFMMEEPADVIEEACYFHRLNTPRFSLLNEKIKKKLTVTYSDDTLPYLIEWKSRASGDYALGIEPCTSFLDHHFKKKIIHSGESIINKIQIEVNDIL